MKIINRIKTLYWFWKLTKDKVDKNKWVIQTGEITDEKWMEMWTDTNYWGANKRWRAKKEKSG